MLEFNFVYKRSYSCFKVYYMQYAWHLLYLFWTLMYCNIS